MEDLKQNWDLILQTFKERYELQDISFNSWIKPIEVYTVENDTITLIMSSTSMNPDMAVSYVEKKYLEMLRITICEIMNHEYDVRLITAKDKQAAEIKKAATGSAAKNSGLQNLNPNYTFDTFVVGTNNNLAHAASLAVAETPGQVYNPLFIYGGVGLGKTHLMQAIAHFIITNDPTRKVLYVTSETFTNELIDSVKNQKNSEFRKKYRNIDVLLIDDIQFIIGKESTQEEFFHTFNALYQDSKQIVISSDRPPKEMETLTERLRTRFEMGLPVDIQIPTYETKRAILKKKVELGGYNIPDDVQDYVATHIKSSIRELEGALTKIVALSKLEKNREIDIELAEKALKDIIAPGDKQEVTPEFIIQIVADHFNLTPLDIMSAKRSKEIVYPRQIVMYLCRTMTETGLQNIGKALGGRDHTTILHGIKTISADLEKNPSLQNTIDILKKKISPQ